MRLPLRSEAITHLLAAAIRAAQQVGDTPADVLELETGGRACLLVLGVTPHELATAERTLSTGESR